MASGCEDTWTAAQEQGGTLPDSQEPDSNAPEVSRDLWQEVELRVCASPPRDFKLYLLPGSLGKRAGEQQQERNCSRRRYL